MFNWISKLVSKVIGGVAMSEKCENAIIQDSYYLINLFKEDSRIITQLVVQKLMYFFEAYYMNMEDTDNHYDCPFKAWTFGPVAMPLYDKYKRFGSSEILLTEKEINVGNNICDRKKQMLKEIYDFFGEYTAMQLVNLTHMVGSPWYNKWLENGERITYGPESNIDKIETRVWFRNQFITE